MCLTVLSPWQLKYYNVLSPEEVYFLMTRVNYVHQSFFWYDDSGQGIKDLFAWRSPIKLTEACSLYVHM